MTTNTEPEARASDGTTGVGARSVDDFLTDIDAVLGENVAPVPTPGVEHSARKSPAVEAEVTGAPPTRPLPTRPAPTVPQSGQAEWWKDVYGHQDADLDTFTGNTDPVRPAQPPRAPIARPPGVASSEPEPAVESELDAEQSDQDGDDEEEDGRSWWTLKKRQPADDSAPQTGGTGSAPQAPSTGGTSKKAAAGEGLITNPRGRQVLFAATAYAMGWSLGLDDMATGLMEQATQYALPVAGCSLGAGVLGLSARSRFGGVVFVSSLGLIILLETASPARVVGGGLALGLHIAYRTLRRWVGPYGARWPWKGVVWMAFVPAATSTVAFLLYGTN